MSLSAVLHNSYSHSAQQRLFVIALVVCYQFAAFYPEADAGVEYRKGDQELFGV
jgi:hypothetical protein